MKICILGAGKIGTWFSDALCLQHEVAIYDPDVKKLKFLFNTQRFSKLEEIREFEPELLINAVVLNYTIQAFREVLPYLPANCMLSDIASVKTGIEAFYRESGFRFVSTHPMFGPTFANLKDLGHQHAIIITESDEQGKEFFKEFYTTLGIQIHDFSFDDHDQTTAYSLSIPISSTLVFAACMKKQDAPGTTFKRHFEIAKGVMSEDDYLLTEILFNPYTYEQVEKIRQQLKVLLHLIKDKDSEGMKTFLASVRKNILE